MNGRVLRGELTGAGLVPEGTERDAAWIEGGFADGVILSLLMTDVTR